MAGDQLIVSLGTSNSPLFPKEDKWDLRAVARDTVYSAVLGRLILIHSDGKLSPGLLKRWTPNSSFTQWELELQSGLEFYPGRAITSADLEFSIVRYLLTPHLCPEKSDRLGIRGAKAIKPGTSFRSGVVEGVQIIDPLSIRVELEDPNPAFPLTLAGPQDSLVPMEEIAPDYFSWRRFPVGAGPFRVISPKETDLVVEKKVPGHSGPKTIRFTTEPIANPDLVIGGAASEGLTRITLPLPARIQGIYFNFNSLLAQDPDFRKAVELSVDRAAIAAAANGKATSSIIPSTLVRSSSAARSQDTHLAAELFKKALAAHPVAGPIKIPVNLQSLSDPSSAWVIELGRQLENAGLKVSFEAGGKGLFDSKDTTTPFFVVGFIPDLADPALLYNVFRLGSPWISSKTVSDPEYEALVDKTLAAPESERASLIQRLGSIFTRNHFAVPLFEEPTVYWVSKKVRSLGDQWYTLNFLSIKMD